MALRPTLRIAVLRLAAVLALAGACGHAAALTVSAASSLTQALRDLAPLFEAAQPGSPVRLNFGASGALLAQAARGAPVDVLVTADSETMDQAQARNLVRAADRRDIASNTLVVAVPVSAARPPRALAELAAPGVARIAVGVPASVPAGRYAKAVLEQAGLWPAIEPKVVGAQAARQALDYVARGEVDAAFVYATDAALMADRVRVAFTVATVTPIRYPAAALAAAPDPGRAARFVEFLLTPAAQAVLARHGFGRP